MVTILVIDDDPLIRTALEWLVAGWGFNALSAESEDEAVAKLDDGPAPALMIVDWRLAGGRTGGEAVTRVRAVTEKNIPVIVVSGETSPNTLREIASDRYSLLSKPVDPGKLRKFVEQSLNATQMAL